MPGATSKGFPYPLASDPFALGNEAIQDLAEELDDYLGAWTSYSPDWQAASGTVSIGTGGSVTGRYRENDVMVDIEIRLIFGTTPSVGTGAWSFASPVEPATSRAIYPIGIASIWDSSASSVAFRQAYLIGSFGADRIRAAGDTGTDVQGTTIAWASGDQLCIAGRYPKD